MKENICYTFVQFIRTIFLFAEKQSMTASFLFKKRNFVNTIDVAGQSIYIHLIIYLNKIIYINFNFTMAFLVISLLCITPIVTKSIRLFACQSGTFRSTLTQLR